jgi:hypothetical protein
MSPGEFDVSRERSIVMSGLWSLSDVPSLSVVCRCKSDVPWGCVREIDVARVEGGRGPGAVVAWPIWNSGEANDDAGRVSPKMEREPESDDNGTSGTIPMPAELCGSGILLDDETTGR